MTLSLADFRGFNYSGSWGTSGLDLWQHHNNGLMAVEVARGKHFFPGWNVARWWLSHESFQRQPDRFLADFDAGLDIFARHEIAVMPVLFNRWRDPTCDFGGVPLDHLSAAFSNQANSPTLFRSEEIDDTTTTLQAIFADYLMRVVGDHNSDERVIAWDLCNEPFSGPYLHDSDSSVRNAEVKWLGWCYRTVKRADSIHPVTVGNRSYLTALRLTEKMSDFLSFHPYFKNALTDTAERERFESMVDNSLAFARSVGKDIIASETVWGALDDARHAALAEYTLGVLCERNLGFIVHALHHSLIADLHRPEFGPIGKPECLHFIEVDGSLREGHDVFNRFPRPDR